MWRIFQADRTLTGMAEIRAADLSVLVKPLCGKLIIYDLQRRDELERYRRIIPGARPYGSRWKNSLSVTTTCVGYTRR